MSPRKHDLGDDAGRQALAGVLLELDDLVTTLRRECPWDREQDMEDIVTHTLEETYELIDAVHTGRPEDVTGELGDLLFHIFFLSHLSREKGWDSLEGITRRIIDKLVLRHPHVFGETAAGSAAEVVERWERIKREKEGREGIFHDVPSELPSPLYAQRMQARAAAAGFDWETEAPIFDKLDEEVRELREALAAEPREDDGAGNRRGPDTAAYHEMGDMLFAVVNLARKLRVNPELALRSATRRFRHRVERAAELAAAAGEDFSRLPLDRKEEYYQQAKQ
ncbi:MAG: nucleoside triphosphate pyrophosphohydrolase [Thermoleophilia bacterium]|nr:nucleoside triphosphate pyrophosphohydrolase [Thermoleophilia bacterium]